MKTTHLALAIIALCLGAVGIKFSLDQQKVISTLIIAHGGNSNKPTGSGLIVESTELDSVVAEIAKARGESVEASEKARLEMGDMRNKCNDAQVSLDEKKAALDDVTEQVRISEAEAEKKKADYQAAMDGLRGELRNNLPDISEDDDLTSFIDAIRENVEISQNELKEVQATLKKLSATDEKLVEEVAKTEVVFAQIKQRNDAFFHEYTLNDNEYSITATDPRWHFVVFNAPVNHGFIPGDSVPLIVKRGDQAIVTLSIKSVDGNEVMAVYDPKTLPAGVQVEKSDRVFRKKPLGQ